MRGADDPQRSGCTIPKSSEDLYHAAVACFETIGSICDLEGVAEGSAWQDFERLAAFIFEKNGFTVNVGTVKTKGRQRRQYDVIAKKDGRTLLVECKQWSGGRYRLSALKRAVTQHRERAVFYGSVMHEATEFIVPAVSGDPGLRVVPVIVTLIEEEIRVFEGVPLVPVHRLDAFIHELDDWADDFTFAEFEEEDRFLSEDPTGKAGDN